MLWTLDTGQLTGEILTGDVIPTFSTGIEAAVKVKNPITKGPMPKEQQAQEINNCFANIGKKLSSWRRGFSIQLMRPLKMKVQLFALTFIPLFVWGIGCCCVPVAMQ